MSKIIGVDAAKLAGLQIDMLQKMRNLQMTIEHLEWFNKLRKEDRDWLVASADPRLKYVHTLSFFVPEDFVHATCLGAFAKNHQDKFAFKTDSVIFDDEDFARVTDELIPGQAIGVDFFESREKISFEDCLIFLRRRGSLLLGAQGLITAIGETGNDFPEERCLSLDKKNVLWKNPNNISLAWSACRHSKTKDFLFDTRDFREGLYPNDCLLLFRDLPGQNRPMK